CQIPLRLLFRLCPALVQLRHPLQFLVPSEFQFAGTPGGCRDLRSDTAVAPTAPRNALAPSATPVAAAAPLVNLADKEVHRTVKFMRRPIAPREIVEHSFQRAPRRGERTPRRNIFGQSRVECSQTLSEQ